MFGRSLKVDIGSERVAVKISFDKSGVVGVSDGAVKTGYFVE